MSERLKLPSCQSAEDQETQATLMTMKRRRSVYRKQKSVQKSLLTSSERARVPIRALVFWDICTPMRVKMELRPSRAQTNA